MSSLDDLKAGDAVILSSRSVSLTRRIVKVTRVTPARIVIAGASPGTERQFRRKDGGEVGEDRSSYYRAWVELATPESIEEIRRASHRAVLIRDLKAARFSDLTDEQLEAVAAIVFPPPSPERAAP